ncbi:MAG: hypothetical protein JKX93_11635, partial [Rhizobiaceae bacterium]|nr:hypothetical protein [Rhizobiaceae bacterium]
KDFETNIGKTIGVSFESGQGYFFNTDDGERLRTCAIAAKTSPKKTKRKAKP